jgi:HSP20 family protein
MERKGFDEMREQVQRLMSEFFKDVKPLGYRLDWSFHPPMDVYETEDELVVVMEVAGMEAEEIQVSLEGDLLLIRGTRTESCAAPKIRLHQMEIDYGRFERNLRIPFPLKADQVKAAYRQGFLTVTIPKLKATVSQIVEVIIR